MSSAGNMLEPGGGMPVAAAPQVAENKEPATPPAASDASSAGSPPSPMMKHFGDASSAALARYQKLQKADETLQRVRKIVDKLGALGDLVAEDDVLEAASDLVGVGLTSSAVAGMLADVPQNAEGIQQWVQGQEAQVGQREAQLEHVMKLARHELALTGLRGLIGDAAEGHQAQQAGMAQQAPTEPQPEEQPTLEAGNAG